MGSSSAEYMPVMHSLVASQGATFSRMYASVPVCCPSRSSLYTGQYQHNNHVMGNAVATNCSSLAWQAGPETRTFAVPLRAAGYETFFAGKYLNDYGGPGVGGTAHIPPGWRHWQGLVGNSAYYNFTMSNNGTREPHGATPADWLVPAADGNPLHWEVAGVPGVLFQPNWEIQETNFSAFPCFDF